MMITLIKNILSNKERKQLLNHSKPLLLTGKYLSDKTNPDYEYPPSKQTLPNLHQSSLIKPIIIKILTRVEKETGLKTGTDKVWINWNSGKKEEQCWHTHLSEYAMVYYIKTFPFFNNGTCFKDKFVRAPQNSLIMFTGNMSHSVPSYPFYFERYTLAMDLNIIR